ncbi:MAG: hypothetical protein H6559_21580 [Lewinellaceae bacterium]|nr:hypothetical protein [Lewinellaceae bacterium]
MSDDIDFESLRFHPRFDRFLRNQVGSFDRYIERLEKICSVLFAFTFLILFMLLSVGGIIALVARPTCSSRSCSVPGEASRAQGLLPAVFLGSLLYFLDFVTLGYLKRIRWLAPVYYPIYRFFSLITFARLYRPIYYNLIDNRFGRGVGFLLVPYIAILLVGSSLKYVSDTYFPKAPPAHITLNPGFYDDLRAEDALSDAPGIPSRYVSNGFLEVFIPYLPEEDDKYHGVPLPRYLDIARTTGITLEGAVTIQEDRSGINADSILLCMGAIHQLFVNDSLIADPKFRFFAHPGARTTGLSATMDVQYLPWGATGCGWRAGASGRIPWCGWRWRMCRSGRSRGAG